MRSRRGLGLEALFVVLVVIGLVPVAALVISSALHQRDQAKERGEEETARLGRLAALREADLVDSGRDVLAAIAKTTAALEGGGAECAARLEALLALYPRFTNLGVVSSAGELVCAAIPPSQPTSFGDRAWFRRAVSTGRFAVGDYQLGRITGRPSLVFGLPLEAADGAIRAVAWAALDLGWLQQFSTNLQLPGDPALTVLDRTGTILARQPQPERWVGRSLPGFDGTAFRRGPYTFEGEGPDGVRRLYAVTPLGEGDDPHALVVVGIPTSVAYADADATLRRNLAYLALLAVVGVVAARFAAQRLIVRPARALVAVSGRLAAGELDARVAPPYPAGELGDLSRAFNQMADALQMRDVALSRAVADRRRTTAQLQAVIDNAPWSVYLKDSEGRYLLVNRRFEEESGARGTDLIGRRPTELFPDGPLVVGHEEDMAVFATGEPSQAHETIDTGNGVLTFLTFRFPLADVNGCRYAMCRLATDITEHIEGQAHRERLEAQLNQAQRLESLGQLAGGVAHDFNNLLAVILNYADFVLDSLPEEENPPEEESIRSDVLAIRRAGEAAAALTRQLLIFGRRDRVEPRLVHLDALLEAMEPFLRRTLGEDIVLEVRTEAGLPAVWADPGRLEQVIMNLVVNARDAMESGGRLGITVEELNLAPGPADLAGLTPGPHVHLAVSDTGAGMPPEVADRAFEPFFTTKPKGHGTGLGLATVFGIVSEAGGAVSLESSPDHGTTVHVHLPAVAATPPDSGFGQTSTTTNNQSPATILVVEDEHEVRQVTERILISNGYTVLTAPDGAAALQTCHTHPGPIDLVVTDVVMPGLSGPDFIERARTIRPDLQAIFMSGYPEDFLARRHSVDGEVKVIGKPFTADILLRSVLTALKAK